MRFQLFGLVTLLASGVAAAPGGGGPPECSKYYYKPDICPHCPYKSGYPRALEGRGGYDPKCYKECPKEYLVCSKYEYKYGPEKYSISYKKKVYCKKDYSYDVEVKTEDCSGYAGKKCLSVYYGDKGKYGYSKRGGISYCNLGLYEKPSDVYVPSKLNYNSYCHGDYCSVPMEKIPGYSSDMCGKTYYIAIGNDVCYKSYGSYGKRDTLSGGELETRDELEARGYDYKTGVAYLEVTVTCEKGPVEKKCVSECCCPKHY